MKMLAVLKNKFNSGSSGEWTDKIVKADDGIITKYIDKSIDKASEKLTNKVSEYATYFASDAISILEVGAIGFGLYHCVIMMFTQNKSLNDKAKPLSRMMLSYFAFFLLRMINTVLKLRGGVIGN